MAEKENDSKKKVSADWLLRGALTRIGDTVDRLMGRKWAPSSSIATSELIERIKKLLDAESKKVPGKGTVVPHNIKLKMQWDKFSTDAEEALARLQTELLTATVDHINDSLYYTYAPVALEVKPDYFIEGVKLYVSFERFTDEDRDVEMNVTVPAINVAEALKGLDAKAAMPYETFVARFALKSGPKEKRVKVPGGGQISVGRTGSNDLVIDDASVSKIHASLSATAEGTLSVADTGSTNGTFINGQRIAYGKATRIVEGDILKFGTVEVTFEHQPVEAVIENEAEAGDEVVEIDGFEFKRKDTGEAADKDSDVVDPASDASLEETLPVVDEADGANDDKTISNADANESESPVASTKDISIKEPQEN